MGHEFAARKQGRENKFDLTEARNTRIKIRRSNLPCSSFEPVGGPLENKAKLITLTISNDDILQFFHDRLCTPGHEP